MEIKEIKPNFSKFDDESNEEKALAYANFLVSQRKREKREKIVTPIFKSFGVLICIILLFVIVVALSGIPRSIHKEFETAQYRMDDETYVEYSQMTITGKLYKRFFSNPKFVGSIMIDNFEITKTYNLFDLTFYKSAWNGYSTLTYSTVENGMPYIESIGTIWMSNDFEDIMVWVFEPIGGRSKSSTVDKALIIVAPTKSREAAINDFLQYVSLR